MGSRKKVLKLSATWLLAPETLENTKHENLSNLIQTVGCYDLILHEALAITLHLTLSIYLVQRILPLKTTQNSKIPF